MSKKDKKDKDKQGGGKKKKISAVKEPKDRTIVEFYLNQSFLRTQEKKDL